MLLKVEKDTTLLEDASLEYPDRESDYTFGFDYLINENFTLAFPMKEVGILP